MLFAVYVLYHISAVMSADYPHTTSTLLGLVQKGINSRQDYKFPDLHNPPNLWRRTSEDAKPPVVHVAAPFCT
ncbi:hypothetical protein MGG_11620 [Pyricularia oryzae 70-15]|uniref:Uncharacterized protein n=1 Tax=Pyricularia oryzae (strain 70-15 / ATCC MYA-4617 / FGSC 8958) TaxID=242507 RepID=G4NDC2_PYRO7|nr:uncharacterized protein MGG_11620 [Pyricularia oryzae 70-15]EHA49260.1 hypothetical protein MGG_11620 [Pyricularia oryzae 70-15]